MPWVHVPCAAGSPLWLSRGGLTLLPAARALPIDAGPAAVREQVGAVLDWLGQTFLHLWAADSGDNGQMIDPNDRPNPGSASSSEGDNGKSIDPNG